MLHVICVLSPFVCTYVCIYMLCYIVCTVYVCMCVYTGHCQCYALVSEAISLPWGISSLIMHMCMHAMNVSLLSSFRLKRIGERDSTLPRSYWRRRKRKHLCYVVLISFKSFQFLCVLACHSCVFLKIYYFRAMYALWYHNSFPFTSLLCL